MKVAIYTLGCKVNQYETQAIEKLLRERGHIIAGFSEDADAYVINTCSVTAASGQKSRQAVRRVQREHPGAVAAVSAGSRVHNIVAAPLETGGVVSGNKGDILMRYDCQYAGVWLIVSNGLKP